MSSSIEALSPEVSPVQAPLVQIAVLDATHTTPLALSMVRSGENLDAVGDASFLPLCIAIGRECNCAKRISVVEFASANNEDGRA